MSPLCLNNTAQQLALECVSTHGIYLIVALAVSDVLLAVSAVDQGEHDVAHVPVVVLLLLQHLQPTTVATQFTSANQCALSQRSGRATHWCNLTVCRAMLN